MATQQLGDGNDSDTLAVGGAGGIVQIAGTSGYAGFYGATPVVQRATAASHTTIATTVVVSTTGSNMWGFTTSSQGNAVLAAVAEIQATLVAIGIWAA